MPGKTYVTVVGNAGSDPELRYTPTGSPVATFSLAVTPRFMQNDAWQDGETTWYRINAWRTLAENIAESIQRGMRVIVFGSLENRSWEDNEGNKRTSLEITADACGPDLMFATASLRKSERDQGPAPDWAADPEPVEPEPAPAPARPARNAPKANASRPARPQTGRTQQTRNR